MSAIPQHWVAGVGASVSREQVTTRADEDAQRDDRLMEQLGRGAPHALDELPLPRSDSHAPVRKMRLSRETSAYQRLKFTCLLTL